VLEKSRDKRARVYRLSKRLLPIAGTAHCDNDIKRNETEKKMTAAGERCRYFWIASAVLQER